MWTRCLGLLLGATLLLGLGAGCKKAAKPAGSGRPSATTIARIHWLGKNLLASETNAAGLMKIWGLPETAKLEAQTLDKLATAPWRRPGSTNLISTNAASAMLRPLLDDLISEESFLEVRVLTNHPAEAVLAIRLDKDHAGLWQTNLAAVLASVTGTAPSPFPTGQGWSVKRPHAPNLLELTRAGDWTLIGLAQNQNDLLREMVSRIQTRPGAVPFSAPATNYWLEAEFDLGRLAQGLQATTNPPAAYPRLSLKVIGDGENTRTLAQLTFPKSLPLMLEPWNFPTNLVSDPLVSFTAVRGIQPWLASLKLWQDLGVGAPPNQYYFWAKEGIPWQTYCAAPVPNASNVMYQLSERVFTNANTWIASNSVGRIERPAQGNGLAWVGVPFMGPFISSVNVPEGQFILAGLLPRSVTNNPPPTALMTEVTSRTNLLYYDWELTGPRIDTWARVGQLFRVLLKKAQMDPASASMAWVMGLEKKLGNSATLVTLSAPETITLSRKSAIGLTAAELHLFADWLESPEFPWGLHTLLAKSEPLFGNKPNASNDAPTAGGPVNSQK